MIDKLLRTLETLQHRNVETLGYEARIRHQQRIAHIEQLYRDALAERSVKSGASSLQETVTSTN